MMSLIVVFVNKTMDYFHLQELFTTPQ